MDDSYRDADRLELILELIEKIERRLEHITRAMFEVNIDEIDLTAFRLGHIGEAAYKLSEPVKARHPEIEWVQMYRMRNIVSHDYRNIMAALIWKTATEKLNALRAVCRAELRAFDE